MSEPPPAARAPGAALRASAWPRLLLVLALGAAWYVFFPGYLSLGISLLLLAGWATAWDLLGGWTGQTSLGHAAFVGLGAYTIAVTSTRYDLAPWWGALLAMALAAVLALLWGRLTFGLRGSYFVLASIAIAEILRLVAINERELTGGAIGLFIFNLKEPFGVDLFSRQNEFWISLGYLLLVLLITLLITRGKLGYQMRAVREDEASAQAAGIDPVSVKLRAFMLSAALTALGGCIYGIFLSALQPQPLFELHLSVRIALVAIIGGRGTLFGPLVGASLLTLMPIAPCTVRGLPPLRYHFRLKVPRIPERLLHTILTDAHRARRPDGGLNEALYQFHHHGRTVQVRKPAQQTTATHVTAAGSAETAVLCDLHSHGNMSAFWSATDNADEQGSQLYAVIGKLDTEPEIRLRVGLYGYWMPLPVTVVFTGRGPFKDFYLKENKL